MGSEDRSSNGSSVPGGQRVLIVDDEADTRRVLSLTFSIDGFEVVGEAADGVEALHLARREQPDFIILDHLMPRMRGDEAATLLRAIAPGARIVAFSAALDDKPEWADAFLNKTRMAEVLPLIRQMI